jgi:uncharacterized Zn finger protein
LTDDRLALAFLGTFESLRMGPTFARGRRDERAGHVRHLTISASLVVAQVRGPEEPRAFRSRIALRAFGAADWARVEEALAAEARYAADLLAGRMPAGIAAVVADAGLSLVPLSLDEVAMDCSCERWPMPCVHLAATTYALVRSFEEDPFGVFAWRGRPRDELLAHLRELRGARAVEKVEAAAAGADTAATTEARADLGDPADFWGATPGAAHPHRPAAPAAAEPGTAAPVEPGTAAPVEPGTAAPVTTPLGEPGTAIAPVGSRPGSRLRPDALLDQLDPPHLSHDGRPIVDLLRPAYRALPDE